MMPSSSANVEAPPTEGMQLTEGALAGEVPAGVHPGALSSNARAGAGDMNTASAGDTNGAAPETPMVPPPETPMAPPPETPMEPPETPMEPPARCASCWP